MDLVQFGTTLKNRRVGQQISLTDISSETRINIRFLEAIERGDLHVLPQTYVRAFLREYALIVGIAPEEIMHQYDEILAVPKSSAAAQTAEKPSEPGLAPRFTDQQMRVLFIGGSVLGLLVIALFFALDPIDFSSTNATEVSFDRVVRESEATATRRQPLSVPTVVTPILPDSLRLEIATMDSVWISLTADNLAAQEFLFGPNRTRAWMAKDRFLVTMGNAGGATFRLNGVDLGALGRRGAVVRNIPITLSSAKNPLASERQNP
jgi:cytoskeletal protein RodZ